MLGRGRAVGLVDDHIGVGEARLDIAFVDLDVLQQVAVGTLLVDERRVGLAASMASLTAGSSS